MREFRVVRRVWSKKEKTSGKPYYVADKDGNPLTRRNGYAIRESSTEKAAQKIADLCNESERNGGY